LRSLAGEGFCYGNSGDCSPQSHGGNAASGSWLSRASTFADWAATAGFVASMIFLAATAIYAFSLSDSAKPFLAETATLVDEAALDAGFKFKSEEFALSGTQNTPDADLLKALKLPYKGSSLFYDAGDARRALLTIGWIESAEVRRILPSRLEVAIVERKSFARWEDARHKVQIIDREGHILGPDEAGRFAALPLFAGEGAAAEAAAFVDAIDEHEAFKHRVQRIDYVAERFWTVKLDTGPALKLPRKVTPLALERLDSLLANPKIAGLGLETIDLRLSNRTILQLLEPTVPNRDKAIAVLNPAQAQALPPPKKGKAL
jgi:cell division protein FtsQ